jgi:hypothetical protein|tara:strand:- start:1491 stop:1739 length:249 start_codon:yes stop_codon:yes gene_type:complete
MLQNLINRLKEFSTLVLEFTKAGVLIIALIMLVYLLLGDNSGPYVQSVIVNIGQLISIISSEAIIGIALVILSWLIVGRLQK